MNMYQKEVDALEKELNTNFKTGLSDQEVEKRLKKYGPNALPEGRQETWVSIFLSQFQSPLIYILLIAAVIIFFVGEHKMDAFIISGILFFNAIVGTIQEGRTSNIIASLKRFIKAKSVVIRDGKHTIVDDADLVPGDIIVLQEGERVPADARLFYQERLKIDEAVLTGESKPVSKTIEPVSGEASIGDQKNMVFKGTYVASGYGTAVVVGTGVNTQIGAIHSSIEQINTDIPLRRELNRLSYFILILILVICTALLIIGLLMGRQFNELMVMLTALFICVVPEGLPVVLTLVLVTGAYRMAKKHVLIKNLQGVEALGRTDVIVIDKTGTLTRNEMMVTKLFTDGTAYSVTGEGYFDEGELEQDGQKVEPNQAVQQIGIAGALLNSTELSYSDKLKLFEIKGDPTEAALYVFAKKIGFNQEKLATQYKEQFEIPFSSESKYHAGFYLNDGAGIAYLVGAPEEIFAMCSTVSEPLKQAFESMLADGLRVVAVASKKLSADQISQKGDDQIAHYRALIQEGLTLLGVCGIQDAIRPEVKTIIEQARNAGLKIVMATGDHQQTAEYVAKKVGIYKEGDQILDGKKVGAMSDKDLAHALDSVTVFARVSPQDKVRIIQAAHDNDYIVGMTGDGVNDVPSLVAADLGIAMGRIGTEVAKQASDLVLLDDSFVHIIAAIEQGRHIFYTLRRVALYFFATNLGEILIVLVALFTNLPLPLTASQILWLNFVTDGFLDVGLSMEPEEEGLLHEHWLKKKLRLIDMSIVLKSIYFALPMGIVSLIMFRWCYDGTAASIPYARTMTLITMAMFQWFNAWNCRSERKPLYQIGFFSNKWLFAATVLVLLLQFAICYLPFMQYIFKTVPLSLSDWGLIVMVSSPLLFVEEARKIILSIFNRQKEAIVK